MRSGPALDGVVERSPDVVDRWQRLGYWTDELLGAAIDRRADQHGQDLALVDGDRVRTYAELAERAARTAGALFGVGVRRGDRVVVRLPNTVEFFEVVFGLFRLGAIPVFALAAHRRAELEHFCRHSDATVLITTTEDGRDDLRPMLRELERSLGGFRRVLLVGERHRDDPDSFLALEPLVTSAAPIAANPARRATDVAFLQLSGGSTGVPKLIPRTHAEYLYSVRESARICGLGTESVLLAVIPVAHNFTLSSPGSLGVFHAGGRVVLASSASPDTVFELIADQNVTIVPAVPSLAMMWVEAAERLRPSLSSLEVLQVGGAMFDPAVAARVAPALGCRLQQVFGMAEGLVNYTRLDDPDDVVLHSQGRPISPDDELLIVDDDDRPVTRGTAGHLLTRGPYTIAGYYRAAAHNARTFTAAGFYRTGDIVRIRDDGNLVVEGRHKDQINRGGEKIAAAEIEDHLRQHSAVADVAVVGIPDRALGERTCAFVVAVGEPPTRRELRRLLSDHGLAAFKLPDRVEIVGALPLTPVGKVAKSVLRSMAARSADEETT
ncbi:MAG: (2,3-dihydroxybenzoyl)adenylate synthase [Desertimonas sp.]